LESIASGPLSGRSRLAITKTTSPDEHGEAPGQHELDGVLNSEKIGDADYQRGALQHNAPHDRGESGERIFLGAHFFHRRFHVFDRRSEVF